MLTRAAITAETRTWIGTPYRHQASLKGVGCDCLGLVRGVWRALCGHEPEAVPAYSRDWAEAAGCETLALAAGRHMTEIGCNEFRPGDVLLFRWRTGLVASMRRLSLRPTAWCMRMTAPRSLRSRWRRGGAAGWHSHSVSPE